MIIYMYYVGSDSSDGTDTNSQLDSFVGSTYNTDPGPIRTGISSSTLQSSTAQHTEKSTTVVEFQRVQPADFLVYVGPL